MLKEINQNLLIFLLAGYETTSTTLSYCLHVLATHPVELTKLQAEIDNNFGPQVKLTNSDANGL